MKELTKRARKTKSTKNDEANKLIEAIKFISSAQSKEGTSYQRHCVIKDNYVFGFDGLITIGTPLNSAMVCCPHTFNMLKALANCGEDLTVINENLTVTIKSGKFKSVIDCVPLEHAAIIAPDPLLIKVDDKLKLGFDVVSKILLNDNAGIPVVKKSVLLKSGSVVCTDGIVVVEFWHGFEGIPPLMVPKKAVELVAACSKPLVGIGGSADSITFHYEDGSYIRSGVYPGVYPDYERVLFFEGKTLPPPAEFFEAIEKVSTLSEDKSIYFLKEGISSSLKNKKGCFYEFEYFEENMSFNFEYILRLKPYMSQICFTPYKNGHCLYFFGENVRGVIAGMVPNSN